MGKEENTIVSVRKQAKYTAEMASACVTNFTSFPMDMRAVFFVGLIVGGAYPLLLSLILCSTDEKILRDEISGRSVVVTGASRGIGKQLAYSYAKRGAKLIITARTESLLQKVAKKCQILGASNVDYVVADMSKMEDVFSVFEMVRSKFSERLDYLVLNHVKQNRAANWIGSSENMTVLAETFQVNYFAYVQLASLFLPYMQENAGRIVVVSSFVGRYAFPFFVPYVSSKFALEGFFGGLRHELNMNKSSISITTAVLGRIDTPGQREAMSSGGFVRHGDIPAAVSAERTAEAILVGSVDRRKDIYYPTIRPMIIASKLPLISDWFDWFVQYKMQRFPND